MRVRPLAGALLAGLSATALAGFLEDDAGLAAAAAATVLTDGEPAVDAPPANPTVDPSLKDCLSVPTYPGKCRITASPGACYTVAGDSDPSWQCWVDNQSPDTETDEYCQQQLGKAGACQFKDHGKVVTDADLPSCFEVPGGFKAQCSPVTDFWGACYKADSQVWMCLPKGDPTIPDLRTDCQVTAMPDQRQAYDGACTFGKVNQTIYKCDTVKTYNIYSGTSNCQGPPQAESACFSLRKGQAWQCVANGTNPSCRTTLDSSGELFDGACVYDISPLYPTAADASGLTTTSTTTTTVATTTTTSKPGGAAGLTLGAATGLALLLSVVTQLHA